ncbi:YybH family protein [Oceanicoccus sagamiensis]|nr:nuclear transport factor 2 family protein [Oceanicoccus sagamiensis]
MQHSPQQFILLMSLFVSLAAYSDTRTTLLDMEAACSGQQVSQPSALLKQLGAQCRPQVNHGGAATPAPISKAALIASEPSILDTLTTYTDALKAKNAEQLASVLTEDFVIIQPGGNAWDKQTYLSGGVAHVIAMFSELSFDLEPVHLSSGEHAATVIVRFRLGGLHMGKPATTFGLGTINLVKADQQWLIQHIHNSGMQVY